MYICADLVFVCVPPGLAGPGDVPGAALPFFAAGFSSSLTASFFSTLFYFQPYFKSCSHVEYSTQLAAI